MPRSGIEVRERLEQAALELYGQRGYDQTTTAEIAAKAGVTERTFFRHFADKREVLFNIEGALNDALTGALAAVPATEPPLAAVVQAFRSLVPEIESNRAQVLARYRVISATPALQERELTKAAALSVVVAQALRARGLPDRQASLLAQVSTTALGHAMHTWVTEAGSTMDDLIVEVFADLGALAQTNSAVANPQRSRPRT